MQASSHELKRAQKTSFLPSTNHSPAVLGKLSIDDRDKIMATISKRKDELKKLEPKSVDPKPAEPKAKTRKSMFRKSVSPSLQPCRTRGHYSLRLISISSAPMSPLDTMIGLVAEWVAGDATKGRSDLKLLDDPYTRHCRTSSATAVPHQQQAQGAR